MSKKSSLLDSLVSLTSKKRNEFIASLSNEEAEAILYEWPLWARREQRIPEDNAIPGGWFTWLIRSGRGWGKTRTGSETVCHWAKDNPYIALIGRSKSDIRDTMVEMGDSSILKVSKPGFKPDYQPSKRRLVWPNGSVASLYSGDEPDQLRGPQHYKAWVDELAKFQYPDETMDMLEMGLRLGTKPQVIVTTTPRPIKVIKRLVADPRTIVVNGSTYDNKANLAAAFIQRITDRYSGTRLGRQEIEGEILEDNPNALWTMKSIEDNRVKVAPDLIRIVIPIDPEAASDEGSAETGIVPVGQGANGHYYVLEDCTIRGLPHIWAARAVSKYQTYAADLIIGEVNNGGDMIESVIKNQDPTVNYKAVRATRGKIVRAEPISALYEQGKVHHVGSFPELEDQMCNWVPGERSPDRMDSLVWGITELSGGSASLLDAL